MAGNKKITELTAMTTPDDTDVMPIADVSLPETKKITFADLKAACISGIVSGLSPTGSDVGATSQIQVFTNGIKTAAQDAVDIRPYGVSAGNTGELRFYELVANGSNYVGVKAADARAASVTYILPSTDPLSGQVLAATTPSSNISILSWASVVNSIGGANTNVQFNNSGDLGGNDRFSWDNGNEQLLLKNSLGISFPSYSFVDAPTMGMYYDSGNLGITADTGTMLLTCAGLSMNGNAGFTGTGTYTNFTVENGIITSAS